MSFRKSDESNNNNNSVISETDDNNNISSISTNDTIIPIENSSDHSESIDTNRNTILNETCQNVDITSKIDKDNKKSSGRSPLKNEKSGKSEIIEIIEIRDNTINVTKNPRSKRVKETNNTNSQNKTNKPEPIDTYTGESYSNNNQCCYCCYSCTLPNIYNDFCNNSIAKTQSQTDDNNLTRELYKSVKLSSLFMFTTCAIIFIFCVIISISGLYAVSVQNDIDTFFVNITNNTMNTNNNNNNIDKTNNKSNYNTENTYIPIYYHKPLISKTIGYSFLLIGLAIGLITLLFLLMYPENNNDQ